MDDFDALDDFLASLGVSENPEPLCQADRVAADAALDDFLAWITEPLPGEEPMAAVAMYVPTRPTAAPTDVYLRMARVAVLADALAAECEALLSEVDPDDDDLAFVRVEADWLARCLDRASIESEVPPAVFALIDSLSVTVE